MALSIGIVGLPNVGKSTLFTALTKRGGFAANYPFATIEPNTGIVDVPDPRLQKLAGIVNPAQIVPATVEFVDIAGLVKGASTGEGLGNQFLANIRETNAIVEVVRFFTDEDVIHVSGAVAPATDAATIETELILADIESLEKQLTRLEKEVKRDKSNAPRLETAQKLLTALNDGTCARNVELSQKEQEYARDFFLLTMKPVLYVANVDETELLKTPQKILGQEPLVVSAKVEAELAELDDEDAKAYLQELGLQQSGLEALTQKAYETLGLMSYFTAGPKEVRAWTVRKGALAPEAAGVIHSDFERGFIKAEVASYEDFVSLGGEAGCKEKGKLRQEGKDYIVQDGDVMHFKFNV